LQAGSQIFSGSPDARDADGIQNHCRSRLDPDEKFFEHLANRRFPITWWIREESELDYLEEPMCSMTSSAMCRFWRILSSPITWSNTAKPARALLG